MDSVEKKVVQVGGCYGTPPSEIEIENADHLSYEAVKDEIVEMILRRREKGIPYEQIAAEFNAFEIPSETGRPWRAGTVQLMLSKMVNG